MPLQGTREPSSHTNGPRRPSGRTVRYLLLLRVAVEDLITDFFFYSAGLTIDDVLALSPNFWELHQDPLMAMDGGAMTLVTIQVNLSAGTIARQAVNRPELVPLVDDLLSYRKQYVHFVQ